MDQCIAPGRCSIYHTNVFILPLPSAQNMLTRQPWLPPDTHPKDFDKTNTALLYDHDPNAVPYDPATLVHHNKFGVLKSRITNYDCLRDQADVGLMSTERKGGHRALEVSTNTKIE